MDTADKSKTPTRATRRRPRGKGIRVRTGCLACRQRHLKCDETQPICRGCQKSSRECIYPQNQHQPEETVPRETPARRDNEEVDIPNAQSGSPAAEPPPQRPALREDVEPDETAAIGTENIVNDKELHDAPLPPQQAYLNGNIATNERAVQLEAPSIYPGEHVYLPDEAFRLSEGGSIGFPEVYDPELFGISPEASYGGWPSVSAEAASRWWFDLLASDVNNQIVGLNDTVANGSFDVVSRPQEAGNLSGVLGYEHGLQHTIGGEAVRSRVALTNTELQLFHHYVLHLSGWIDATDPDEQFAVIVPDLAMENQGLASAILALSSLHLSLHPSAHCDHVSLQIDSTTAVQYYNDTLQYLQHEMGNASFLRSDELLATVLIISTFEMIETQTLGSAWDKHLRGVFWIQRSQTIHGESEGLKKRIWWAWLRQDIWSAFRGRRQILSFYKVTRACSTLGFWELVDRAVYLLGQCINYASTKEEENGRSDIQRRLEDSAKMSHKLQEWLACFQKHDRRLPTSARSDSAFRPIWINPPAASLAVQVHHFSKLLLLEYTPAIGGMKELINRQRGLQAAVEVICGIALCTVDDGKLIVSTQCVFAAGHHVQDTAKRAQVLELLQSHRTRTGWPHYDIASEMESFWAAPEI